jgi:hypothetical protein
MSRHFVLLGVLLFLCTCASQQQQGVVSGGVPSGGAATTLRRANPCAGKAGSTDRNAPIVCVDDTGATLSVSPDPIRVHDVGAADRLPVAIHWYTVSGANDLHVEIEPGCVTDTTCDGNGHCMARSTPRGDKTEKRCKYDVWTDKHPRLDPDMIIIPCC